MKLVNQYYDIATDFYEWAWGYSFHFAPRYVGESVKASIARHEHFLAARIGLKPGMRALDVGCGVGGPMMEIARFSGGNVTGINNNSYQISRGEQHVKRAGLNSVCSFLKGDFMQIPTPDATFDCAYAIEATCHAPTKVGIYSEVKRILKPGGLFAAYEWCLTESYDKDDQFHQQIKEDIEVGDGLADIDTTAQTIAALKESGFEIVEVKDLGIVDSINPISWYDALCPGYTSLSGLRLTKMGVTMTHTALDIFERIWLVPKGTTQTHSVLMRAQRGLLNGGATGSFTPMFYFLVRKPLK